MNARIKIVGLGLTVAGFLFMAVGGYTYVQTQAGGASLAAYSAAENVKLTYNSDGQLADKTGSTEEATHIMSLLVNDWKYPVVTAEFDPNDPVVNTGSEYMYQMATVTYHTLNSKVTVTLAKNVTAADGAVTAAGDYAFTNDGKYWATFGKDPVAAAARGVVWSPTAHALIANLGVGAVTASALQMGLGIAAIAGAMGLVLLLLGLGLVWSSRAARPA
jgi:hypothetical protein